MNTIHEDYSRIHREIVTAEEEAETTPTSVMLRKTGRGSDKYTAPRIQDWDVFLQNMYAYYNSQGFWVIVSSQVVNLILVTFTAGFSIVLFGMLEWKHLMMCRDAASCQALSQYLAPFPPVGATILWAYVGGFALYWLWCVASMVLSVKAARDTRQFYAVCLHLQDCELTVTPWSTIVQRLDAFLKDSSPSGSGCDRLSFVDNDSDGFATVCLQAVACRIMRRENFMIALMSMGFFDSCAFTNVLLWCLRLSVVDASFGEDSELWDAGRVQFRLRVFAVGSGVLMPFVFPLMVVYVLFKEAETYQSHRHRGNAANLSASSSSLGGRTWSPRASWTFREYNELPHVFEARLAASHEAARAFLGHFTSPVWALWARCATYVAGVGLTVLLMFAMIDEAIVLHVYVGARNLLWYVAVLSTIMAVCGSWVPVTDSPRAPDSALHALCSKTHYMPDAWTRGGTLPGCLLARNDVLEFFPHRVAQYAKELASVIAMPYVLGVVYARRAWAFQSVIRSMTVHHPRVGLVTKPCLFLCRDKDEEEEDDGGSGGRTGTPWIAFTWRKERHSIYSFHSANGDAWIPAYASTRAILQSTKRQMGKCQWVDESGCCLACASL